MKLKGYPGKILCLDLTHSEVSIEDLNDEFAKQFIGGNRIIF
jgi:aldehyde:ferredoxin oxidoreductase